MNEIVVFKPEDFLEKDGQPWTTSQAVAKYFEKRHDNVLRDIRQLMEEDPGFSALNFEAVTYLDEKGEVRPCFRVSFNGFILLTMGYNGPKATPIKTGYIREFNRRGLALAGCAKNFPEDVLTLQEGTAWADQYRRLFVLVPMSQFIKREGYDTPPARLSIPEKERIVALHVEKVPAKEIAAHVGRSLDSVMAVITRYELGLPPVPPTRPGARRA